MLSKTLVLHHRNTIAALAVATTVAATSPSAATVTTIILSDATIGITIIEMKTKAALKAAYEHLSAATTYWVVIYHCVIT